jgi:hypothetical protein
MLWPRRVWAANEAEASRERSTPLVRRIRRGLRSMSGKAAALAGGKRDRFTRLPILETAATG